MPEQNKKIFISRYALLVLAVHLVFAIIFFSWFWSVKGLGSEPLIGAYMLIMFLGLPSSLIVFGVHNIASLLVDMSKMPDFIAMGIPEHLACFILSYLQWIYLFPKIYYFLKRKLSKQI